MGSDTPPQQTYLEHDTHAKLLASAASAAAADDADADAAPPTWEVPKAADFVARLFKTRD